MYDCMIVVLLTITIYSDFRQCSEAYYDRGYLLLQGFWMKLNVVASCITKKRKKASSNKWKWMNGWKHTYATYILLVVVVTYNNITQQTIFAPWILFTTEISSDKSDEERASWNEHVVIFIHKWCNIIPQFVLCHRKQDYVDKALHWAHWSERHHTGIEYNLTISPSLLTLPLPNASNCSSIFIIIILVEILLFVKHHYNNIVVVIIVIFTSSFFSISRRCR